MLVVLVPFSIRDSLLVCHAPAGCRPGIAGKLGGPPGCTLSNLRDKVTGSPTMTVSRSSEAVNWAQTLEAPKEKRSRAAPSQVRRNGSLFCPTTRPYVASRCLNCRQESVIQVQ